MKSTEARISIRKTTQLLLLLAALLLGSACSSDSPDPPPVNPGYVEGPNQGSGWVGITYPFGPVETSAASIEMGGMTFIPAAATCPHATGDLGNSYLVTWYNDANGRSGQTQFGLNCLTIVFAWWQAPLGMVLLEPGENHVTITSSDGLGNVGRATMTITRN